VRNSRLPLALIWQVEHCAVRRDRHQTGRIEQWPLIQCSRTRRAPACYF
jgi:hypothetical protein